MKSNKLGARKTWCLVAIGSLPKNNLDKSKGHNMEDKLKQYGLHLRELDSPERSPIDFYIEDDEDNICWVWGADAGSVDIECNHPTECIEYGDDEEQGECKLCGAKCDWHWENEWLDEGHDEDGRCIGQQVKVRHIDEWYYPKRPKGLVGEYLKELSER